MKEFAFEYILMKLLVGLSDKEGAYGNLGYVFGEEVSPRGLNLGVSSIES